MKTGDADVVESVDSIAHELGGDDCLFSDRQIGCACAGDQHRAVSARDLSLVERDRASFAVERAPGTRSRTASNASSVVRVTSSECPAETMRSAIAAICAGVFPKPSTTSGNPCRTWRC